MAVQISPTAANPCVSCKVCGADSPLFGVCDFSRSCEEGRGLVLPLTGQPIYYRRCVACGLLFTTAFDLWSDHDFKAQIYNDDYAAVDPDFEAVRPDNFAQALAQMFGSHAAELTVLDYGGGNGRLAQNLRRAGFRAETYDPFTAHEARPVGRFRLISCIETLEHVPDPKSIAQDLASMLDDDGLIFFSTLVQPAEIERIRMAWPYIGPRNGHVTMFTKDALHKLWSGVGINYRSLSNNVHLAFRQVPSFARQRFSP